PACAAGRIRAPRTETRRAAPSAAEVDEAGHAAGDGLAGGDAGRLDAEEGDEPRRAVRPRPLDDEGAERLAAALALAADAGVVRLEIVVADDGQVTPQRRAEARRLGRIDVVADAIDVLDVRPGEELAAEIERDVDAEAGVDRRGVDEPAGDARVARRDAEIVALAQPLLVAERAHVDAGERGHARRVEPRPVDDPAPPQLPLPPPPPPRPP